MSRISLETLKTTTMNAAGSSGYTRLIGKVVFSAVALQLRLRGICQAVVQ